MRKFKDVHGRAVRFTKERLAHLEASHPEMRRQLERIAETLREPDQIVQSRTDPSAELFYRRYANTPVTTKYLCGVVKRNAEDAFLVTAYFTDSIKRGDVLWKRT